MENLFFDIIWYLAIIFSILWFISKDRKNMLIFWIISTLLFWISIYLWYGWINWLICSLISIIVKLFSLMINNKYLKYLTISAPLIWLLIFFISPEWLEWIIPSLSMFFIVIADSQKDVLKMKYWYYWSNLLWLSYGIILWSISAILFDVFWFFALTYGIYNILQKRKNNINDKK